MNSDFLRQILEAAIMVSDKPMDVSHLEKLFDEKERPHRDEIRAKGACFLSFEFLHPCQPSNY